ncbi:MAG: Fe-S cluster biogenesis protein NfuA [Bacteroidia bacterium]|jgi:Fe-S cluster biogenesis protein NfuA|tara:strand:+ start:2003 stop:2233 length:231 start_codon:yes stop_codon:yes gene_type:complete
MSTQEITIEEALESMRPFLRKDGGDVALISYEDNIVKLKLLGACSTCDISHLTMKAGLEEAIKNMLPEVKQVLAVD